MSRSGRILTILNKIYNSRPQLNNSRRYSLSANVSKDNENLIVKSNDNTEYYPLIWLRDNCRCENCFHKDSQSRIINWYDFKLDVKVKNIQAKNKQEIKIKWNDDHESTYAYDWLKNRSFSAENQQKYLENVYIPMKKTWNKEKFFEVMKIYEYKDIMTKNESLYDWLKNLSVYGVVLIKNAPKDAIECRKLSEKIAFIRKTHYGEDFHVVAKAETNNVAYLANPLQLHTDLPYYDYKPGVNLLHCIVQTENKGGENLLSDAFYVAEKIRAENKRVFDILSQTQVNWSDIGEEAGVKFYKIHRAPVITLDSRGNIHRIRHSIPQRDSHFTVRLNDVKPWYKALKIFVMELYKNAAEFKTQPGDILAFDNTRLVHGRIGYQDTDRIKRFLVGHFVDWDEIYSKMRVLQIEFDQKS